VDSAPASAAASGEALRGIRFFFTGNPPLFLQEQANTRKRRVRGDAWSRRRRFGAPESGIQGSIPDQGRFGHVADRQANSMARARVHADSAAIGSAVSPIGNDHHSARGSGRFPVAYSCDLHAARNDGQDFSHPVARPTPAWKLVRNARMRQEVACSNTSLLRAEDLRGKRRGPRTPVERGIDGRRMLEDLILQVVPVDAGSIASWRVAHCAAGAAPGGRAIHMRSYRALPRRSRRSSR